MTRINLVDPCTLSDQHLFTEWREMPRIVSGLQARLTKGEFVQTVPHFRLGTGHMLFFYDKMGFLSQRYKSICKELTRRGHGYTKYETNPFLQFDKKYMRNYVPSPTEVNISKQRLLTKLKQRPNWYRYEGQVRSPRYFKDLMQ
jgi:deoxyribonuclease (pyrimidine dimer)